MSRTNDRKFLFDRGKVKEELVNAMKRAAAFSAFGIGDDVHAAGSRVSNGERMGARVMETRHLAAL